MLMQKLGDKDFAKIQALDLFKLNESYMTLGVRIRHIQVRQCKTNMLCVYLCVYFLSANKNLKELVIVTCNGFCCYNVLIYS